MKLFLLKTLQRKVHPVRTKIENGFWTLSQLFYTAMEAVADLLCICIYVLPLTSAHYLSPILILKSCDILLTCPLLQSGMTLGVGGSGKLCPK